MASSSCSAFSVDSKYYAVCDGDGKLRIWETQKNALVQEFTPNFHLSSPCSCLKWLQSAIDPDTGTQTKRKRRKTRDVGADIIAMGTANGRILLYSVASASVEGQLEGGHRSCAVTCLSWLPGTSLYSCGDCTITEWNVTERKINSKWKAGTDEIGCVLVSPDGSHVLSASRSINLWDAKSQQLLKSFTGHASPVLSLSIIPKTTSNGEYYFLSTAKGDRYINIWSFSKKNSQKSALVAMVLESEPVGGLTIFEEQENGTVSLAAVTQSGALQIFSHQLNGRCVKPLKPALTVQVATEARGKESVEPIPIVSAAYTMKEELRIAYGTGSFLAFENVVLNFEEKIQILARQSPRKIHAESSESSQVKVPDAQKTQYLAQPASNAVVSGVKRTYSRQTEVPMEERLENLSLSIARTEDKTTSLPRADNLAQLMLQALTSKDKAMLQTVLCRREEDVIRNTVKRLPLQMIEPLLKELTTLLHAKTATAQTGAKWLRIVLTIHAAHLMANPSLVELLAPVIGIVESRLSLLPSLSRLSGRLELVASQLDGASVSDENTSPLDMQSCLLMYQDADTSDEDDIQDDAGGLGSESDDHWEELSESNSDEDEEENGDGEDSDVEMSE